MLGLRVWQVQLEKDKTPVLTSWSSDYIWDSNTVGKKLDSLYEFDPYKHKYFDGEKWLSVTGVEVVPNLGFMAFNSLSQLQEEFGYYEEFEFNSAALIGEVNGFGKIAVHQHGFRSEYMQVTAIVDNLNCMFINCPNKGHLYWHNWDSIDADDYPPHIYCGKCFNKDRSEVRTNFFATAKNPLQYHHDRFIRDLSNKYEVPILTNTQLINKWEIK